MMKLILIVVAAGVLLVGTAALYLMGRTPLPHQTVLVAQGEDRVVVVRETALERYFDFSFRQTYAISLIRVNGDTQVLYRTDHGANADIIEVMAVPGAKLYQLKVTDAAGKAVCLTRFSL